MATGTKYPRTRGYQTRWARMRIWVCARKRGRGYNPKPNGYLLTDLKKCYPRPQNPLRVLTHGPNMLNYI
jgi:hypothetical protein